jgi:hypothetical protein
MANAMITGKALRQMMFGMRALKAATANGTAVYFRVYTGLVAVTAVIGKVTVEAVGATTLVVTHVPTAGATIPVAASLDIDPATVGSYINLPLLGTSAALYNASTAGLSQTAKMFLPVGAMTFTFGAASGTASWTVFYVPIEDGAYVAAATA